MKQKLTSIRQRFCPRMFNRSATSMASVSQCVSDTIACVGVMIEYAYVYYYHGGHGAIVRPTSSAGGVARAFNDTDNIDKAAMRCIDIIDYHRKPK